MEQWALVKLEDKINHKARDGTVGFWTEKCQKNPIWVNPSNIHEGEQALLEAMLAGPLNGYLRYRKIKPGDLFISANNCGELLRKTNYSPAEGERVVFTPPEPEPDRESLEYLKANYPEDMYLAPSVSEWVIALVEAAVREAKDAKP